jgi:hypothetical protein
MEVRGKGRKTGMRKRRGGGGGGGEIWSERGV